MLSLQEIHRSPRPPLLPRMPEEQIWTGIRSRVRGPRLRPFGRASARSSEAAHDSGGYRVFSLRDDEGPAPRPGQFYMLAAGRHWEEDGRRPFLPRALSVADAVAEDGAPAPRLPDRGDRARDRPPLRARGRRDGLGQRPARQRLLGAAPDSPRRRSGRSSSAAASASRRWRSCAGRFSDRASRPASCSASATASTPAASTTSSPAARSASPARTATPATTATSPTCWRRCSRATTPRAPSSTPAARRRCSTRSRDLCAERGRRLRARPWSRRWPAASAPASAAPCPTPTARLPAPLRRRPGAEGPGRDRDPLSGNL